MTTNANRGCPKRRDGQPRFAFLNVKVSAGRDLRFYVHDLHDAKIRVDELGGDWEGVIGDGHRQIRLKAGGEVTLVTDQAIRGQLPYGVLGHIESPPKGPNEGG